MPYNLPMSIPETLLHRLLLFYGQNPYLCQSACPNAAGMAGKDGETA